MDRTVHQLNSFKSEVAYTATPHQLQSSPIITIDFLMKKYTLLCCPQSWRPVWCSPFLWFSYYTHMKNLLIHFYSFLFIFNILAWSCKNLSMPLILKGQTKLPNSPAFFSLASCLCQNIAKYLTQQWYMGMQPLLKGAAHPTHQNVLAAFQFIPSSNSQN